MYYFILIFSILASPAAMAFDFVGTFQVSSGQCEDYKDLITTPINCNVHLIVISYVSSLLSKSEKICITEDTGNPSCFESFEANVGSSYQSGKLIIQNGNAYYNELKQADELKDRVNWKLEARGSGRYEFIRSIQHSTPFSSPAVTGQNSTLRLTK